MDNDKYSVQDLIKYSYNQQPIDFENAFNSLITDKIATAIDDKKRELAGSMVTNSYGPDEDDIDPIDEPYDDVDDTDYEEEENYDG
jgi:hypothetical protein